MAQEQWDQFLHWARVVAGAIDLEAKELNYKRETAARLSQARKEFLDGDASWSTNIVGALRGTNLLHWRSVGRIERAAKERSEAFSAAVGVLWNRADVDASALSEFDGPIREAAEGITPGNVVALGARS